MMLTPPLERMRLPPTLAALSVDELIALLILRRSRVSLICARVLAEHYHCGFPATETMLALTYKGLAAQAGATIHPSPRGQRAGELAARIIARAALPNAGADWQVILAAELVDELGDPTDA